MRMRSNGLWPPLTACCQVPRQGEDHPPTMRNRILEMAFIYVGECWQLWITKWRTPCQSSKWQGTRAYIPMKSQADLNLPPLQCCIESWGLCMQSHRDLCRDESNIPLTRVSSKWTSTRLDAPGIWIWKTRWKNNPFEIPSLVKNSSDLTG